VIEIVIEGIKRVMAVGGMVKWLKQLFSRKRQYKELDERLRFTWRRG
jgi:hypothetical protein